MTRFEPLAPCRIALYAAVCIGVTMPISPALAQARPTLDQVLSATRRNARKLAVVRADLAAAVAAVARARGALLPSLSVSASYTRNQYEAIARVGTGAQAVIVPQNQLDLSAQLAIPLLDVTAWRRMQQSQRQRDGAQATLQATEQEVLLAAARLYASAHAAQERVRSALRAEASATNDLRYVSSRRDAGAATELQVDRARLELERARQLTIDTRRVLEQTLRLLGTLAGLQIKAVAAFTVDLRPPPAVSEQGIARRPELVQAQHGVSVAELGESEARWSFLPTLGFTATERVTNATGFSGNEASYQLALVLRWGFDFVRLAAIDAQQAQTRAARARLAQLREDARDALYNARLDVLAGIATVRTARKAEQVAVRAADIARTQFRLGAATQREVIDGERDRVRAEAERAQAEADLVYARLALRRAAGAWGVAR